ncbi:MAG TPA: hypothetical protein VIF09_07235 [Polyangiaceae bacterium]
MKSFAWALVASAVVLVGCTEGQWPEPRTLAARQAARCGDESSVAQERVASPSNVEQVEPLYAIVDSTPNGQESRLLGAKLHLRPLRGETAESMTHALYCHETAEVLRGEGACPYSVPDGWVDISVKSEGDGYVVKLEGQDFRQAKRILERAQAFAHN